MINSYRPPFPANNFLKQTTYLLLEAKTPSFLITDPLKVFDSFSVFVEPISYQRIFHLVSVFYITAHLVNIILEMQLTLISARRATDCCRSPLLVAFEIPGVGFLRLRSLSN